jgi:hypothetical protein
VKFASAAEVKKKKRALQAIVRAWVADLATR